MKAIVLCAGYATRLYPLTLHRPKPLLQVGGRPIIEHILEKLERCGKVDKVFIVTNHKFYKRFRQWQSGYASSLCVEICDDGTRSNEERLGAIGDLRFVISRKRLKEDLLIVAGDNVFDDPLEKFLDFAYHHRPFIAIGAYDVRKKRLASRYGIVKTNSTSRVRSFLEKPPHPPSTLASCGIYYFPKESLAWLGRYVRDEKRTDAPGYYISWLVKHKRVYAYAISGNWFDIGDQDSYHRADLLYRSRLVERSNISTKKRKGTWQLK